MEEPLRAGSVIAGKYRLLAPVAEGGMGAVWRAEDLQLAAPVAVKLLHARNLDDPETRARFEAEAAIGAQLRSPHVVQIFEMGVDRASNSPFIAMELLEGESLQQRLARAGALAPGELLRIVSQVARALTRAHALGIIHRDLKPANIFLVRDGETQLAKVLDFGIAKRLSSKPGGARTLTGDLLGTPTYMSPEQILGSRAVDHRSDLWSLGVIAVECLTGRLPFEADHLAGLALAICQGRYLLPSSLGPVPPGFDAWFEKATAPSAEARFESAAQLAEALRQVCGAELAARDVPPPDGARSQVAKRASLPGVHTVPEPTLELQRPEQQRRRRTRRTRLWVAAGGGALLVFIALRVRLPDGARPALPAPAGSAVFSSTPVPAGTPPSGTGDGAIRADAPASRGHDARGDTRPLPATAPLPAALSPSARQAATPVRSSLPAAAAVDAAAPRPRAVSAPPRAVSAPPRAVSAPPAAPARRAASPAPARRQPTPDPDNLGF